MYTHLAHELRAFFSGTMPINLCSLYNSGQSQNTSQAREKAYITLCLKGNNGGDRIYIKDDSQAAGISGLKSRLKSSLKTIKMRMTQLWFFSNVI